MGGRPVRIKSRLRSRPTTSEMHTDRVAPPRLFGGLNAACRFFLFPGNYSSLRQREIGGAFLKGDPGMGERVVLCAISRARPPVEDEHLAERAEDDVLTLSRDG